MLRTPVVAGIFYEADPERLKMQIEACFLSNFGPGKLPSGTSEKKLVGAIVPHAGYAYSGACAAWAYKEIAEARKPDLVVILGPDHTGLGTAASVWQGSDWQTPLGKIAIDRELANQLSDLWGKEPAPHLSEHSIEVQLPFLQYIWKEPPAVLPIIISVPAEAEICQKLGEDLAKAIQKIQKTVLVIISSDFTHYGISYGYLPFTGTPNEVKKRLSTLDYSAIEKIEKLDINGFVNFLKKTSATICGASPIVVGLSALKKIGVESGKLLKYYTSADLTGDWANSVSYASLIFTKI